VPLRWRDAPTYPFGFRLGLWYLALFVGGSALVLTVAYVLLAGSLRARDRDVIESTLRRYALAYSRGGLASLNASLEVDRASAGYEPLFVRVATRGGSAVFFSMPAGWGSFDLADLSSPPLQGQQAWAEISSPRSSERLEVASAWIGPDILFQVGKSTRFRDELLAEFRRNTLLLFGAMILVSLAGGVALTRSALRPLRELTGTVQAILETGTTDARVPVRHTRDPLDELGTLVNRMLDRIDALITGMRGALDHVAHDLRTPMTRLRATAETALQSGSRSPGVSRPGAGRGARLQRDGELPSPEHVYREALADCLEEAERVSAILDALMDIAEAETGAMRLRIERFDLVPLLRDTVGLYEDVAESRRVALVLEAPTSLPLAADRARIAQAIANMVDNAVKYTPAGGHVVLAAAPAAAGAVVTVRDTGIGISPDDLPRIWERLYRGDRSRSERGLGLGLSLVKAIVEAHGGTVAVESTPGRGSTFTVALPGAP
jgi:signal transduction histidine kinase